MRTPTADEIVRIIADDIKNNGPIYQTMKRIYPLHAQEPKPASPPCPPNI